MSALDRVVAYVRRWLDGPPAACSVCRTSSEPTEAAALGAGWRSFGVRDSLGRGVWVCNGCQDARPS